MINDETKKKKKQNLLKYIVEIQFSVKSKECLNKLSEIIKFHRRFLREHKKYVFPSLFESSGKRFCALVKLLC